jgi:hypothetical protein
LGKREGERDMLRSGEGGSKLRADDGDGHSIGWSTDLNLPYLPAVQPQPTLLLAPVDPDRELTAGPIHPSAAPAPRHPSRFSCRIVCLPPNTNNTAHRGKHTIVRRQKRTRSTLFTRCTSTTFCITQLQTQTRTRYYPYCILPRNPCLASESVDTES